MTLKEIRKRLKQWGRYWAAQREGAGFASNSVTGRCCETMRTGIFSQGTKWQVKDRAEEIKVPEYIEEIDIAMNQLTQSELIYIKLKYVNNKAIRNLFVDRAEHKLAGLL